MKCSGCGRVPYPVGFGIGVVAVSGEDLQVCRKSETAVAPHIGPHARFVREGRMRGAAGAEPAKIMPPPCSHGRQRYFCKECGGGGICEHGRRRSRCKECGGWEGEG